MRLKSVLTVPNLVTLIRLCMLPTYVALMADHRVVAASWYFGFLAATDWVDGYLARRLNQVSEFGAIIDPVADRLVFFIGIGVAMKYDFFPMWAGGLILFREISIAVLMVGATAFGMERFPVTTLGKKATFALLCAVPWITLGTAGGWWRIFSLIGWAAFVPGVFISYVSFFRYLPTVKAHMSSTRRA